MQITDLLTRGWHNIQVLHNIPTPRIQKNGTVGLLWRQEFEKWNTKIAEQMLFSCNTPDPLSVTHESEWNKLTNSRVCQGVKKESCETPVLWFKSTLIEKLNIAGHNFIALFSYTDFRKFSLIFCATPEVISRCTRHSPKGRAVSWLLLLTVFWDQLIWEVGKAAVGKDEILSLFQLLISFSSSQINE